jgi:predicted dehydrogenase
VHVYLEKPIATSLGDARAVLDTHERSGRVGAIGFNFRFGKGHQRARQRVQSGALGTLAYAHSTFTASPRELKAWKKTRDGGALLNLGSHHVDLIPYLLGAPITEVYATLRSQHSQEDRAMLQMQLEDGPVVHSFFSMSAATTDQLTVIGEEGRLVLDRYDDRLTVSGSAIEYSRPKRFAREVQSFVEGVGSLLRRPGEPSFRLALEAFVRSIRTGEMHSPTLLDGYRSLAVLIAAERSATLERPVAVSEVETDPVPAEPIGQRSPARS